MDGVIGYVTAFAGNFAPRGWAFCQGQLLSISQNTAVFSILGTVYGGDGRVTFALPDLRGRAVVGVGQGPGLTPYDPGESGGTETTTMTTNQLAAHAHTVALQITPGASASADSASPNAGVYATPASGDPFFSTSAIAQMQGYQGAITMGATGNSQPFSILHPVLALNYIICLQGVFPSRN